ncbi:MAG: NAD-dependent succinate-semialdehyde dehydrogenase [Gemmataceae bacterium]
MDTSLETRLFINGQWLPAASGAMIKVTNPATEEAVASVALAGRDDIRRAFDAAAGAFPAWSKTTAYQRASVLKKTADLMRQRADIIARTMTQEQGKPVVEARAEVLHSADTFEWFAEEGKRAYGQVIPNSVAQKRHLTIKHPVGVVAAISPWNFPITLQSRKLAPALAAGCTVVSKPAHQTPLSLIQTFQCLQDAGLPPGVGNCVVAKAEDFSDEFFAHPAVRKLSFTGSTAVGKMLMKRAADRMIRVSLELGGHAPFIVLPDADPEAVAKAAVVGKFRNNGQVCISPSRFFVHSDLRKKFTEAAVEATKALKLGNGLESGVEIGPMIDESRLTATTTIVDDAKSKGARVLTGGRRSAHFRKGFFFEPTVLADVRDDATLLTDEPFAPVMPVLDFQKLDEVIERANATRYGLAAYAFTNDLTAMWKLAEGLEAGIIGINDPVPSTPQCPFGGMKESGLGRELGHEGLEAYLETKFIALKLRDG